MTTWTEPAAVTAAVRRRWKRGDILRGYAEGRAWEPISVRITGPRSADLGAEIGPARDWVQRWRSATGVGTPIRLETAGIGGRHFGRNEIPARAWVDDYAGAFALLKAKADVAAFDRIWEATEDARLRAWIAAHPMKALAARDDWPRLLACVEWIAAHDEPGLYLRHVDATGVDTKFIESRRGILAELLDVVLPADRVVPDAPVAEFTRRYRFATKPDYVRWRTLDPSLAVSGFKELSVRVDELARHPPAASRVIVAENEISYLALPDLPETVAIFGAGYGARRLRTLGWLAGCDLVYWGDIDTHGFAILDQVRTAFPSTRSVLMDRATLLAHRAHWTQEPHQSRHPMGALTGAEAALCDDLRDDTFGPQVRLEQERVSFSSVLAALHQLG